MYYAFFFLGLILICLPGAFVLQRKCRFKSLDQIMEKRHLWWSWIHGLNILDLVRGFSGVMLMKLAFEELVPEAGAMIEYAMLGVVLACGCVLQKFFFNAERDEAVTPLFFLAGIAFALVSAPLAAMVLVFGVTTGIALRNIGGGLAAMAVASVGLALVFRGELMGLVALGGLAGEVAMLSLLMHRTMVLTLSTHRLYRRAEVQESLGALR